MPTIGQQETGRKIGKNKSQTYIWLACNNCLKERWVCKSQIKDPRYLGWCRVCGNYRNGKIQGAKNKKYGRRKTSIGYIEVLIYSDNPYYPMVMASGYVKEHRYIMAKYLKRCLTAEEIVHHKDGNKANNNLSNLEIATKYTHKIGFADAYQRGYKDGQADAVKGVSLYEN